MMVLTSDRKDAIDPSDDKQTTVVDCQCLEIVGEAPGSGGQGPTLGALGIAGRGVLTGG